jgi:hypothetical protein
LAGIVWIAYGLQLRAVQEARAAEVYGENILSTFVERSPEGFSRLAFLGGKQRYVARIPRACMLKAEREVAAQPHMARELRKDHLIGSLIGDVMEIGRHCAALPLGPPR